MGAINLTLIANQWRWLIQQQPSTFIWDGVEFPCHFTDQDYDLGLGIGGFIQGQDARLFVVLSQMLEALELPTTTQWIPTGYSGPLPDEHLFPAEGDIIQVNRLAGFRVLKVHTAGGQSNPFGLVYDLQGPDQSR